MYKAIPGNHKWCISLNGEIQSVDGTACTLEIYNNLVYVDMFGKEERHDRQWLALLAHFEVNLPEELRARTESFLFVQANPKAKTNCGFVTVFTRPIVFKEKYRIIPGFTDYAVSQDGEVVRTSDGEVVTHGPTDVDSYLDVEIYNPDKGRTRYTKVHRLVALAWVRNTDPFSRYNVNHKNGIKSDCRADNLEWVTVAENNIHAFETGLRSDNRPCRVRNVEDGVVTEFVSVGTACAFMGFKGNANMKNLNRKTKSRLLNGKFEFRLTSDQTPWFFESRQRDEKAGRYSLCVKYSDGREESHPDVRTFKKKFGVWNVSNVHDLKKKAEAMYPDMTIVIEDHYLVKPVQAYNLTTGEITDAPGVRQLGRIIGREYASIHTGLNAGETRVSRGFAYRYKSDEHWDLNFTKFKGSSRCISATHSKTDEELEFSSLTKVAQHFNVDRSVIKRCLLRKIRFNGWDLRES